MSYNGSTINLIGTHDHILCYEVWKVGLVTYGFDLWPLKQRKFGQTNSVYEVPKQMQIRAGTTA